MLLLPVTPHPALLLTASLQSPCRALPDWMRFTPSMLQPWSVCRVMRLPLFWFTCSMTSISPFCGQLAMLFEISRLVNCCSGRSPRCVSEGKRVAREGERERDILCQPQGRPCTAAGGGVLDIEDKQAAVVLNLGSKADREAAGGRVRGGPRAKRGIDPRNG